MTHSAGGWYDALGRRKRCNRCVWRRPSQRGVCRQCFMREQRQRERDRLAVLFDSIAAHLRGHDGR